MSNQNKKNRARRRQQKTGVKYTEAIREQDAREALTDRTEQTNLLARLGRESKPVDGVDVRILSADDLAPTREHCDHCGGGIRWVPLGDLKRLRPDKVEEVMALGPDFWAGDAWVCLECDNFGIVSLPQFEGSPDFWTGLGIGSESHFRDLLNNLPGVRRRTGLGRSCFVRLQPPRGVPEGQSRLRRRGAAEAGLRCGLR